MPRLNLKPNHKAIRGYYATLQQYDQHAITHEGAVSNPFTFLLDTCAKQVNGTLIPQYPMRTIGVNLKTVEIVKNSHPYRLTASPPDKGDLGGYKLASVVSNRTGFYTKTLKNPKTS